MKSMKTSSPRLPVKSLLRFKTVCKQWRATISDPKFPETHLRLSNNSSPRPLLEQVNRTTKLVRFENDGFRELSAVDYPPAKCAKSPDFCHCDGLLLLPGEFGGPKNKFFLWNPSSRTYKELRYPHSHIDTKSWKFGICYDPLVKNYKVVIGDDERYAVFYCKTNSWSKTKKTNASFCNNPIVVRFCNGVSFNGSFYWILYIGEADDDRCEIVRFDGRDEEFKNPWRVDVPNGCLISSREALYLFPYHNVESPREDDHIIVMKKVGGNDEEEKPWMEIKVQLPCSFRSVVPLCWTHENQILLMVCCEEKQYLLYDNTKGSFTVVKNTLDLRFSTLFPHMENMFLL